MFEEKNYSNNFEITKNQKQNHGNKLKFYFQSSTFLAQQQQLSHFIRNFPIIHFDQISSVNKLIEILIKQNQILASKCQQNSISIAEMFSKHEELLKHNHKLQKQNKELHLSLNSNQLNQKQIDSYEQQLKKITSQFEIKQISFKKQEEKYKISIQENSYLRQEIKNASEVLGLITERSYKKGIEKIKNLMNNRSYEKKPITWVNLEETQRYLRQEKKKLKFYPKIKETVQMFCSRLIRVIEYIPIQIFQQQLQKQISILLQIIEDLLMLKSKKNQSSSQSRLDSQMSKKDQVFFESLLSKVARLSQHQKSTTLQCQNQVKMLKQTLMESKSYYEENLTRTKIEFDERIKVKQEEIIQKQQIIAFYEEQQEKLTNQLVQKKENIKQYEQELRNSKLSSQERQYESVTLQKKLQIAKQQWSNKQKELYEQWDQNKKTFEYKLSQKQIIIQECLAERNALKSEHQQKTIALKQAISSLENQMRMLTQKSKLLQHDRTLKETQLQATKQKNETIISQLRECLAQKNKQLQQLSQKNDRIILQIKHYKDALQENQRQGSLQKNYINELEVKNKDLLGKLKIAQNKKNEEKTVKKQLTAIKQTIDIQKRHSKEAQQHLQNQREQNQRLKNIIKSMKKELEEVYIQFNNLKVIESDREKLIRDMQKSDRAKEDLNRQYQKMKVQLCRYEQDNKRLVLQMKHYKNALSRIQILR